MNDITVLYSGKEHKIAFEKKPIEKILIGLKINPETVLVRRGDEIVPETELPRKGDVLEILNVASGG